MSVTPVVCWHAMFILSAQCQFQCQKPVWFWQLPVGCFRCGTLIIRLVFIFLLRWCSIKILPEVNFSKHFWNPFKILNLCSKLTRKWPQCIPECLCANSCYGVTFLVLGRGKSRKWRTTSETDQPHDSSSNAYVLDADWPTAGGRNDSAGSRWYHRRVGHRGSGPAANGRTAQLQRRPRQGRTRC